MPIRRHDPFLSQYVQSRPVDVWLPPGYDEDGARYPVIYMHDGQNLFDPRTSYSGVDWGIDEALTALMREGVTRGAIVVGVWNAGVNRWREYMPERFVRRSFRQRLVALFTSRLRGVPYSDAYLRFLVTEVKPFVDNLYRTLPDPAHTSVMGSSLGGLISLYALEEYPDVFGAAACVSTHWPAGGDALVGAMADALPPPGRHRLYFDYGTETTDAAYEPFQERMDARLAAAGYTRGVDWRTEKFAGADHSERAWRERVALPLSFLLENQT
jgi:predicted alpha/beta superfamily hydrolase